MSQIKRYFISLGKACNMHCIYCHQGGDKPVCPALHVENADVQKIRDIVSYFPKTGKYAVTLYGGEPLLYWDTIVRLVDALRNNNPDIKIGMPTNGLLLTTSKALKLNELDVMVGLSHDGPVFEKTRRSKDILKINPEPFLTLNTRSISAVVSKLNWNFYDVWEYFDEFSLKHNCCGPVRKENIQIQIAKDVENNTPEELLILDMPEFEQMLDKVFDNLENHIRNKEFTSYEYQQYRGFIETLNLRLKEPDKIGIWCGADKQVAHLDMEGNLYVCHNVAKPYGNVRNFKEIKPGGYNPYLYDSKCIACPAYIICGGACPVAHPDKRKYTCYFMYQQVTRLFNMLHNLNKTY